MLIVYSSCFGQAHIVYYNIGQKSKLYLPAKQHTTAPTVQVGAVVQKRLQATIVLSLAVPMLLRMLRSDLLAWAFLIVAAVHF